MNLGKRFALFSTQVKQTLATLEKLPPTQLSKQREDGKWSINQILHHLLVSHEGILKYIQYKIQTRENVRESGFKASWNSFWLTVTLKLPLKMKMPAKLPAPSNDITLEELQERFHQNLNDFQQLIDNYPQELEGKVIFKHPFAGRITLSQTVSFLKNHFQHHLPQIKKLQAYTTQ
ncbi:MAG: DinB family protein [Thermonemataceae bacterium]